MIRGIHHVSLKCGTEEEFRTVKTFYLGLLGLTVRREWPEGIMLDAGNALIEVFRNGPGVRAKGAIRHLAFSTDDVDAASERIKNAGYHVFIEPKDLVLATVPEYRARIAFCTGPLGEEIELFQECEAEPARAAETGASRTDRRVDGASEANAHDGAGEPLREELRSAAAVQREQTGKDEGEQP